MAREQGLWVPLMLGGELNENRATCVALFYNKYILSF